MCIYICIYIHTHIHTHTHTHIYICIYTYSHRIFPRNNDSVLPILASLVAQRLKHLPAMQETWVRYLGWEDALEKETATHSSILAWRITWTV